MTEEARITEGDARVFQRHNRRADLLLDVQDVLSAHHDADMNRIVPSIHDGNVEGLEGARQDRNPRLDECFALDDLRDDLQIERGRVAIDWELDLLLLQHDETHEPPAID